MKPVRIKQTTPKTMKPKINTRQLDFWALVSAILVLIASIIGVYIAYFTLLSGNQEDVVLA